MSTRDLAVGVLGGLLLGAYVGWAFGPNRPTLPSTTATARAAASRVRSACPAAPLVPSGASADDAALIEAQDWQIRALADAAFGRPLVWPDPDLPAEVEESLERALASCAPGVTLIETDCSEPPCLAAFDVADGATVSELCPDIPNYGNTARYVWCKDGSRHRVHVLQLKHAEDYREGNEVEGLDFGKNQLERFQARAEDLWSAFCP